jgi:hypothetical protein
LDDDPGFLDDRHPPVNLIAHKLAPSLPFLAALLTLRARHDPRNQA